MTHVGDSHRADAPQRDPSAEASVGSVADEQQAALPLRSAVLESVEATPSPLGRGASVLRVPQEVLCCEDGSPLRIVNLGAGRPASILSSDGKFIHESLEQFFTERLGITELAPETLEALRTQSVRALRYSKDVGIALVFEDGSEHLCLSVAAEAGEDSDAAAAIVDSPAQSSSKGSVFRGHRAVAAALVATTAAGLGTWGVLRSVDTQKGLGEQATSTTSEPEKGGLAAGPSADPAAEVHETRASQEASVEAQGEGLEVQVLDSDQHPQAVADQSTGNRLRKLGELVQHQLVDWVARVNDQVRSFAKASAQYYQESLARRAATAEKDVAEDVAENQPTKPARQPEAGEVRVADGSNNLEDSSFRSPELRELGEPARSASNEELIQFFAEAEQARRQRELDRLAQSDTSGVEPFLLDSDARISSAELVDWGHSLVSLVREPNTSPSNRALVAHFADRGNGAGSLFDDAAILRGSPKELSQVDSGTAPNLPSGTPDEDERHKISERNLALLQFGQPAVKRTVRASNGSLIRAAYDMDIARAAVSEPPEQVAQAERK